MYYQRTMLYRVLDSFLRHKWLFIVSAGLIVTLLVFYTVFRPAKYQSTLTVVLSPRTAENPLATNTNDDQPVSVTLSHTVNQLQALIETKEFMKTALTGPNGKPVFMHLPVDCDNQDELNNLEKGLVVASDNSDSFSVQSTYGDPDDTLTVLSGIIGAYIKKDTDEKTSYLAGQVAFLSQQVADYKSRLNDSAERLAVWKKSHPAGDPTNMAGSQQQLENLKERRDELRVQIASAEERVAVLKQQLQTTPRTSETERVTTGAQTPREIRVEQLKDELNDDIDVKGYTSEHPVVIALKKQIARLETMISADKKRALSVGTRDLQSNPVYDGLQNQLLQTSIDLKSLRTELSDTEQRILGASIVVSNNPDYERQLAELTRNYRIYEQNYNTLIDRLDQARMSEQIGRKQVTDEYTVLLTQQPTSKTRGKSALFLFIGGIILAILIGGSLVFASEWMDRSLRDPIDAQTSLGVPVLALLPDMARTTGGVRLLTEAGGSARKALGGPDSPGSKGKGWSTFSNDDQPDNAS
ncbi:MAG: hypothetical protein P4L33_13790 [Capsulimonadaceae bacterium]|nr:hypothetical protein [Capsulimonadaceae bacterium]